MKRLLANLFLFLSFLSVCAAGNNESRVVYLSGQGVDDPVKWDFRCSAGRNSGKWGKIDVPCNWEVQGYGEYTYGRFYVDKKGSEPSKEEGDYRTTFSVQKDWLSQHVLIWFDGVMTDCEVRVNGQLAPIVDPVTMQPTDRTLHQGAFYRFAVDATKLVRKGRNQLDVHVWKHSANHSVNRAERYADWWLFGGIFRPVWLEVLPEQSIARISVDASADGTVTADVVLLGDCKGLDLEASVDADGDNTQHGSTHVEVNDNHLTCTFKATGIKTWDPEHPNLYDLSFALRGSDGRIAHQKKVRTGFRTVEVREHDGIYLNGTRIVAKGVNRHSFWPEGGRATSPRLSLMDARLIKQMNMNAVRSHYPPDSHFLDACDSLGILYIDELAGWQNPVDDNVGRCIVPEMVTRDANHPSVYLWSNGNEGGFNYHLDAMFSDLDPQHRHVIHPWADWGGIDTHHYPAYLTGVARFNNGSNIFMPTEFMHAMYDQGGGAGLKDFWDRWTQSPLFAGGYIWAFCDEGVTRADLGGLIDTDGSNAPDGIVGPHRELEGSFYSIREVWSPIQILPFRITASFDGSVMVRNDFLFTNLDGGKLLVNGKATELPDIAPGETRRVRLDLSGVGASDDVLSITCISPQGDTVCTTTHPRFTPAEYFQMHQPHGKHGDVHVAFDPENGQISSVTRDGVTVPFGNGPVAVGMKMKFNAEKSVRRIDKDSLGRDVEVFVARYQGGVDSIVWRLDADGRLWMDAVMLNRANGGGGFDDAFMDRSIRNLGLSFTFPEERCTGMTWLGKGPYRVWKNRLPGANVGTWHKDYNRTITGHTAVIQRGSEPALLSSTPLIYPEFKGYHANLYWADIEGCFKVWCQTENIYLHLFNPDDATGNLTNWAPMPAFPTEGNISFLLDIPAMRSFKSIEDQGPASQPGNIRIKSGDMGLRIRLMFEF